MRALRILGLLLLAAIIVLAAVVVARTLMMRSGADVEALTAPSAPSIDANLAAQHLSAAVKFKTISHEDKAENDPAQLAAQRDWLAGAYPRFAAAATREMVGEGALIWTWKGSDPGLEPIILMAHQDVVPVVEETRGLWTADPFGGEIKDGAVWGRGSIDDKGSLIALMEAADALAAQGFKPRRTILVVSGHDEEMGGTGAAAAAAALKSRGVHALFALDEGQVVVDDFPMTHKPAAVIGISEKGYATLKIVAHGAGGHSSAPPRDTAATTVARAVTAIADHPFKLTFSGPAAQMLRTMAPNLGFTARMAIANDWLFSGVLTKQIGSTPVGASMLHTTIAPTRLSGSPKDNVLPSLAWAEINYRIQPGQTSEDVMARARTAVGALPVELSWVGAARDPSPVSSTTSPGWKAVAGVTAAMFPGTPVAPALVTAATDSRNMYLVTGDVYRFQPIRFALKDIEMIHGVNEHLKIEDLKRMADFYARLMIVSAG